MYKYRLHCDEIYLLSTYLERLLGNLCSYQDCRKLTNRIAAPSIDKFIILGFDAHLAFDHMPLVAENPTNLA